MFFFFSAVSQDVGQAVLESYSRILESLAFTVTSRIEDVLYADYVTQNPSHAVCKRNILKDSIEATTPREGFSSSGEDMDKSFSTETPNSMTLSDFMGWGMDQGDAEAKKDGAELEELSKESEIKHPHIHKIANIVTNKKASYLENLGGLRSPTSRH